ncbi:MAG: hypothetical protein AB7G35_07940 [Hyphomicrobiaceae bacterium]
MSRSHGSNAPRVPQQQQWRQPGPQDPAPRYDQQYDQYPPVQDSPGFNPQGWQMPPQPQGYAQGQQHPAFPPQSQHYPPHAQQSGYQGQQSPADPHYQPAAYPLENDPYIADHNAGRPPLGPDLGSHDVGSYDLGSYAVSPPGHDPRYAPQPDGLQWAHEPPPPGLSPHQGYGPDMGYPHQGQPGHDGRGQPHDGDYDDDYEYEDEPRRGRKWLIVAALVASIGVGGAMAYAYKVVLGPSANGTKATAQVIKAPQDPVRIAPDDPGGKRFAHADDKFTNRLPPVGGGQVDGGIVDSNGVRHVSTVRVGRDMAVEPPQPTTVPGGVPGMTIIGAGGPGAPVPPAAMPEPPRPPARVASVEPTQAPPARVTVRNSSPPPPPPRARPRTDPPPQHVAAPRTAAVTPAPRAKTSGFVAVLGYQKGRMEALKMLADIQQKYSFLQGQKLDVVESDQTARGLGVIYRVVVGPPTSRSGVSGICTQMKAAGYKGCWPMAR